jgi:hypothetical protein
MLGSSLHIRPWSGVGAIENTSACEISAANEIGHAGEGRRCSLCVHWVHTRWHR